MQIRTNPSEYGSQTRRTARCLSCIIIAALLIVGLAGCGLRSENPFPAGTDTMKQPRETEESVTPSVPGEIASWDLINKAMEIMGDTSTVIVQMGEETINDEHCYLFATGENALDGSKFTALNHYAISDSGSLYYMDIPGGGIWIDIESGPPADAAWWGEYQGSPGKLYIHNYSGKSFRFVFISHTGEEFEGVAAVYQHDFYKAEYMDLVFSINREADLITVIQSEEREDSAERSQFTGSYTRVEDE